MLPWKTVIRVHFFIKKAFATTCQGTIPEKTENLVGQIKELIPVSIINEKKGNPPLFFEVLHKFHLMLMDILKCKTIHGAFLGIEADRNSLHRTDIVYCTFLVKIG